MKRLDPAKGEDFAEVNVFTWKKNSASGQFDIFSGNAVLHTNPSPSALISAPNLSREPKSSKANSFLLYNCANKLYKQQNQRSSNSTKGSYLLHCTLAGHQTLSASCPRHHTAHRCLEDRLGVVSQWVVQLWLVQEWWW